jgi:hypothetical protein
MAKPSSAFLQQSAYAMKPALLGEPSTAQLTSTLIALRQIVWF